MRVLALLLVAGCGRLGFGGDDDTPDAGTDVMADVSVASRCGTTELICDGFETGVIDPVWMFDIASGTVSVDTSRAYRGAGSVYVRIDEITTTTTNPRALLMRSQGLSGAVTGMVYARVWAFFPSPHPAALFDQLINFADIPGNGISMGTRNGVIVSNDYTDMMYAESATAALPLDRWTCLAFDIPSGVAGTTRVWVDGAEVGDVSLTKATVQPSVDHVYIGLEWVGNPSTMPAVEAWFDEIVVDDTPITCAQ